MAERVIFIKGNYIKERREIRKFGDSKAGPLDDCFGAQKVIEETEEMVEVKPTFKTGGRHVIPKAETWTPAA